MNVDLALTLLRRSLTVLSVLLLGGGATLIGVARVAPMTGHDTFIIRGGSMAPSVPLGSLVITQRADPARLAPGDIVTMRLPNGVVVTHRVTRVVDLPDGRHVETKGDANAAADPVLVPATAVVGTARWHVPVAGYLLAFLSLPTGLMTLLCVMGVLTTAGWLLEEPDDATDERPVLDEPRAATA